MDIISFYKPIVLDIEPLFHFVFCISLKQIWQLEAILALWHFPSSKPIDMKQSFAYENMFVFSQVIIKNLK